LLRFGQHVGRDRLSGFDLSEGQQVALANSIVGFGEDVGTAKTENEQHFRGPGPNAPYRAQTLDDFSIGHLPDSGQRGHRSVQGFGSKITERKQLAPGDAGGTKHFFRSSQELVRPGMVIAEPRQQTT
jgi:hypothetical protein